MKLGDLNPNPDNPRTITSEKLGMLKRSLEEFGDLSGFVYNRKTKRLVCAHQRTKALPKGAEITVDKLRKPTKTGTVAVGYVEHNGDRYPYREVDWDEVKEKAANIAANKGAGEWDLPKLSRWLGDIREFGFDIGLTMFDALELEEMTSDFNPTLKAIEENPADDVIPELKKKAKSKLGDIYLLGIHRLVCGDSTDLGCYKKLFGKDRADITFTSPPYNGNTQQMKDGKPCDLYENYDDDMDADAYVKFTSEVLTNSIKHTKEYVFWNVNYNSNSRSEFLKQILDNIDSLDETIAWKKTALPVPYGLTRTWEPIFVFRCHDETRRVSSLDTNSTEFNFWEINNAGALDESHRAAFPVALPGKALDLTHADSLFDPFGGSGSSLIACEKRGKKCFMIELDPIYVDLIIDRWEKFSGDKAKKL